MDYTGWPALVKILAGSMTVSIIVSRAVSGLAVSINTIIVPVVITSAISAVITIVVAMPVSAAISGRSPPGSIIIWAPVIIVAYPAIADANRKPPTRIWIIMYPVSIGDRSWIIVPAMPWPVIISCTIHYRSTIGI
jgi:hypothetical protein